ncbi:type II toxin-antitoxin system VapB family antitoxin [Candidatus Thiothrix sp. Deng01]|uniref:Type II toxin-antitoxin system VapB family antitoxin n=1 Tax=Candidatus Thiothrix phosphatis TaxID=3112415 RepID=A0ABU6CSL0_9GAMM|nr:type II toxin-antitoxin system VapB family antitoxin [Candidatus Thiothrix sp. Deng01]MEB4589517.1 type II toxin-antitoxin system VapB family antitoxin [Candidatus Thiothrix sp. Deng01]
MATARVFKSGNSQAVRIPREFMLDVNEVEIFRRGDELVLRQPRRTLQAAFDLLASMPVDFMQDGRNDSVPQEREAWI